MRVALRPCGRKPLSFLAPLALAVASCGGGAPEPPALPAPVPFRVEVFRNGLNIPVTMAFAPDGRLFFNELKTGNVRIIENGQLLLTPFATLPVETSGERGLLGLAFDPLFFLNRFVYVFYSDATLGNQRLVRFTDVGNTGTNLTVIVDNLPSASVHNGGNLGFGHDGKLYVTIGDSSNPANSQNTDALAGKILRYNADGTVPPDNPFGSTRPAFNLGLRNSFDFTFHPETGTLYASENGPNCDDEVNRIVPGGNYGWRPNYPCGDTDPNFIAPLIRFTPNIAPTGIAFYTGSVFPQFRNSLFLVDFNTGRVRRFVVDDANSGPDSVGRKRGERRLRGVAGHRARSGRVHLFFELHHHPAVGSRSVRRGPDTYALTLAPIAHRGGAGGTGERMRKAGVESQRALRP